MTLVTRTKRSGGKLQAHKDVLYEREKRRATIVLRLRFRKFLPAWREWGGQEKNSLVLYPSQDDGEVPKILSKLL